MYTIFEEMQLVENKNNAILFRVFFSKITADNEHAGQGVFLQTLMSQENRLSFQREQFDQQRRLSIEQLLTS